MQTDQILMVTGHRKVSHPTAVLFECAALVSALKPRLMKIGGAGGADMTTARAAVTFSGLPPGCSGLQAGEG